MRPDERFLKQPKEFWADVRTISQKIGYARKGVFKVATPTDIVGAYSELALDASHMVEGDQLTNYGTVVHEYFQYRASALTNEVQSLLMNTEQAKALFEEYLRKLNPPRQLLPMNKQKGDKKAPAFLTGLVNMLVWANAGGNPCDYDPRELTAITRDGRPVRTLARRVDGAFPTATNPVALWEIKEYYYTTTFGSRVADGVYESLLDGMELEELRISTGIDVKHYLFIDAYGTWWEDGKSYLCRMIDMMHMGYVDEVIFGREVVERIPLLVAEWIAKLPEAIERQAGTGGRFL